MTNQKKVRKTTWKKGQSGNPNGRPKKGETLTDLLMMKLDKEDFINKAIEHAKNGNTSMLQYIWDRIDGKVKDKMEVNAEVILEFVNKSKKDNS